MEKHQALVSVDQPIEFVIMSTSSSIKDLWRGFWEKLCQISPFQAKVSTWRLWYLIKAIFHEQGVPYLAVRRPVYLRPQTVCSILLMLEIYAGIVAEKTCFPLHSH